MINIIGVDPGGTAGIARLASGLDPYFNEMSPREIEAWLHGFTNEWLITRDDDTLHIVCERFIVSPRTTRASRQSDASDIGGAIQAMCASHHNIIFHWQSPSDGKIITNTVLTRMKLRQRQMPHAEDAMRHALLLLLKIAPDEYHKLLTCGRLS